MSSSSSNDFRDAIAARAADQAMMNRRGNPDMGGPNVADKRLGDNVAWAVLDMPQMQAIKRVLAVGGEDWMRGQKFPDDVIAWVLS